MEALSKFMQTPIRFQYATTGVVINPYPTVACETLADALEGKPQAHTVVELQPRLYNFRGRAEATSFIRNQYTYLERIRK